MRTLSNILVTGGAGFIGSNFIHYLFSLPDFEGTVVNADKLTYAGNPENLVEVNEGYGGKRYFFEKADICDQQKMKELFSSYDIDTVVHFAAESNVDRSIYGPRENIETNILGTFTQTVTAREGWQHDEGVLLHE